MYQLGWMAALKIEEKPRKFHILEEDRKKTKTTTTHDKRRILMSQPQMFFIHNLQRQINKKTKFVVEKRSFSIYTSNWNFFFVFLYFIMWIFFFIWTFGLGGSYFKTKKNKHTHKQTYTHKNTQIFRFSRKVYNIFYRNTHTHTHTKHNNNKNNETSFFTCLIRIAYNPPNTKQKYFQNIRVFEKVFNKSYGVWGSRQ